MSFDKKMELFDKIFNLQYELQKEEKFAHSKEPVMHLIYHLFLRYRRSLKTMKIILESKEIENSYIETLPLLRIQLETYFHIVYITEHEDKALCVKEYENLQKLQLYKIAKSFRSFDNEFPGRLSNQEKQFMEMYEDDKPSDTVPHLAFLKQLAEEAAKKKEDYTRIYSLLSSFVHYNPSTRVAYSNHKENEIVYNQFVYDENVENVVLKYATGFALNTITYINKLLKVKRIEEMNDNLLLTEWQKLFR